jgi:hypothetical protein
VISEKERIICNHYLSRFDNRPLIHFAINGQFVQFFYIKNSGSICPQCCIDVGIDES